MYAWTFAARTTDEIARLLHAMQRHRYIKEVDHRLHWTVDLALAGFSDEFAHAALRFNELRARGELELGSRDPALWRWAEVEEVIAALSLLWEPGQQTEPARQALMAQLRGASFELSTHEPFDSDPDEPPHPELITLDWVLLAVDELDSERHAGALRAMEKGSDDVDASEPVYLEGPPLAERELISGTMNGVLPRDMVVWADGPYSYCEYVFRGVAKAARLVDAPIGYRDIDRT